VTTIIGSDFSEVLVVVDSVGSEITIGLLTSTNFVSLFSVVTTSSPLF